VLSDAAGLATFQPSAGAAQGAIVVEGISAAGSSVLPFSLQLLSPEPSAFLPIEGGSIAVNGTHNLSFGGRFPGNSVLLLASKLIEETAALLCSAL